MTMEEVDRLLVRLKESLGNEFVVRGCSFTVTVCFRRTANGESTFVVTLKTNRRKFAVTPELILEQLLTKVNVHWTVFTINKMEPGLTIEAQIPFETLSQIYS